MERGIIKRGDLQVFDEIDTLGARVRVRPVADAAGTAVDPALVAERDEVVRVERLDVCAGGAGPVVDGGGGTAFAARLVAELPGEDGGAVFVAVYGERDPGLVGGLRGGVGVECCGVGAEGGGVGVYAAEIWRRVRTGEGELIGRERRMMYHSSCLEGAEQA